MKKLSFVALLAMLAACKSENGEAIHAKVLLPSVVATCVRFEVRDPANDQVIESRWLPRSQDDDELRIAIFRGSLPETVRIAARPYRDGDCQDGGQVAPTPNGPYEAMSATFVKDEVTPADVQLRPGTDGDGDGYVGTGAGGADCQDGPGQGGVNPGAQEQCTDQLDLNCDSKKGCEASGCGANACEGPPADLELTLQASNVQAGTCTGATIQLEDANGANARAREPVTVSLQADPTVRAAFYSDAGCTTPATSVNLAAGQGSAMFYFQGRTVGNVTISVAATGLGDDSETAQVAPGPGKQFLFTSPARTAVAGQCSQIVQFEIRDAQNNPTQVASATAVGLSASPSTNLRFYSNASCTTEVASVNLVAGAISGAFYFRGTQAGPVTVLLTATGFTDNSQDQTISPAAPTVLAFSAPALTMEAGVCTQATLLARDTYGNASPVVTSQAVTFAANPTAGFTFSATPDCSNPGTQFSIQANQSSRVLYVRGTVAGIVTVTASRTGFTSGTLAVTVNPGPPALVFTTAAQTVVAGNCSAVATVGLRDSFNNPVAAGADTPVALSVSSSSGFEFFAGAGCSGTPVTSVSIGRDGSDVNFSFRGTIAGTPQLRAEVNNIPPVTQNLTINPALPSVLVFSESTLTMVAGACTPVRLHVRDAYGNASSVPSNQRITFAAAPPGGFAFSANDDCSSPGTQFDILSGQNSRMFYLRGTVAGSVTVTASRTNFTSGTLTATVNPGVPNRLGFQTAAQTIDVSACSGITTVQVRDEFGNATRAGADRQIGLSGSTATITFYLDEACATPVTDVTVPADQISASFYFRDSNSGTVTITATSSGLAAAMQQQTIRPLTPTALVFLTAPQTVAATGCSGVNTVETWAGGTPTTVITSITVNLGAAPSAGFTFYSNSTCTTVVNSVTISAGQGSANFYFRGTAPGTVTITASSSGLASAMQDATITLQPAKLLFTTPARNTDAGVCSAIVTVQTADTNNNPVPVAVTTTVNLSQNGPPGDPQFRFYSDANCSTAVASVTIPARQTTANFYYKGERVRGVTLTAAATGLTSASQNHTIAAGSIAKLAFAASTPAQTLLASTCAMRTVESRDAFDNPVTPGVTFTLAGSTATEFYSDAGCTSLLNQNQVVISPGSSSASFYFKGLSGGINATAPLVLTASATGLTSASQTETIIPTVRTGSCTVAATTNTNTCGINPPLLDVNRAFLVFQATTLNTTTADANARCFIETASAVRCERNGNGTQNLNIRWSVAEFPSASDVEVQPYSVPCDNDTTSVTLSSPVTMENTFLLLSSRRGGGDQGNTVPRTAALTSGTMAQIQKTGGCSGGDTNHLQVVEYPGASVQRDTASIDTEMSIEVPLGTSVQTGRSILLYSYLYNGSGGDICERALRGELIDNGTKVRFSRGDGANATACGGSQLNPIRWEVVQFPAGTFVQQVTQQLTGLSANAMLQPVDLSRTLVIGGGQWASGQVHGEGQYSSSELISEMRARAHLADNTTLTFTRETANNTARFTAYVVELKP